MPSSKRKKNSSPPKDPGTSSGPLTRSRSGATPTREVDLTYYAKVRNPDREKDGGGFEVISKRKLRSDPKNYEKLQKAASKVKQWESVHRAGPNGDPDPFPEAPSAEAGGRDSGVVYVVTNFNIFLYATCFFIQTGTLPYLTKSLGADPLVFGQLQTAFALAQLCGGPIYGRLGDLFGEKIALMLAYSSAATSYLLMGLTTSLRVLFLSRGFSVLMHAMQGSQMILTSASQEKDRTASLARLGFYYGLGMVIGPSLGGVITKNYGEQQAALLASAGSVLSAVLVLFFIPNVRHQEEEKSKLSILNLKEIGSLLFKPGVFVLLSFKFITGVPIGVLQSMFSIIAIEQFGLAADQTGMVLSYVGAIALLMQGFGIGAICKRFSDHRIVGFSIITLTLAYFILTCVRDLQDFLLLLLPLTCSMSLINAVVTASLTKKSTRGTSGQMLGLNMAIHSIIRSFAPSVGGYLVKSYGLASLGAIGVTSNVMALLLVPFVNLNYQV